MISIDPERGTINLYGTTYHLSLFRSLGASFVRPGEVFEIVKVEGDMVTVKRLKNALAEESLQ